MAASIPIYTGQDFYVPYFEVKLQNQALNQDVIRDITQVSYKDSLTDIDNFEITINYWNAKERDFNQHYIDLFVPGKSVELKMGYYGTDSMRTMLKGKVKSLKPNFPAGGQPTLVITGLNALDSLRNKQESHTYEDLTDSDIAKQIAGRLGVDIETDPQAAASEEAYKYIFQNNQYDIVFLIERAKRIGYDLFVEESGANSKIYFYPSVNVSAVNYRLHYGSTLIQFQPNLDTSNQVAKVTVRGWDAEKKTKIEATVERSQLTTRGISCPALLSALEESFKDKEEVISDKPINSMQEAQTLARETLERIAKEMVKGSGSTVGLPDLRAGSVLEIEGLDECFSGRYFVTATTHAIGGSGYTTQFQCRREEV